MLVNPLATINHSKQLHPPPGQRLDKHLHTAKFKHNARAYDHNHTHISLISNPILFPQISQTLISDSLTSILKQDKYK